MERLRRATLLVVFSLSLAALLRAQSGPPAPTDETKSSATSAVAPNTQPPQAQTAGQQAAEPPIPAPPVSANAPHMSRQTRFEIIRDFETQIVYARAAFPMGTKGLTLKDGSTTPNGPELQQLLALWGPALKPGDPAHISFVQITLRLPGPTEKEFRSRPTRRSRIRMAAISIFTSTNMFRR
jgi:hypothetical protein